MVTHKPKIKVYRVAWGQAAYLQQLAYFEEKRPSEEWQFLLRRPPAQWRYVVNVPDTREPVTGICPTWDDAMRRAWKICAEAWLW